MKMKLFTKSVLATILLATATNLWAQSGSNSGSGSSGNFIPELVFQNPVVISGTPGQDGAIYKFSNVATDLDATVRIVGRSSSSVVLTSIDTNSLGWSKAFQPVLGIPGSVQPNQEWWMEFEMRFYKAGTNNKKKVKGFQVTAIDVDGDNGSLQEYLQMNKVKTMTCSSVTYLTNSLVSSILSSFIGEDITNSMGTDKKVLGPVQNFTNIDTSSTAVMATFTYEDKDMITFRYGGKTGSASTTVGERLNSLWFKAFSLAPMSTLPVTLQKFTATYDKKNVVLDWTADTDETFPYYTIERSTDGRNFSDAGIVFTTGKQLSNYQFKDLNAASSTGVLFYRLRWMETRAIVYSPIKVIRLNKTDEVLKLTTYPNPVVNDLRVSLPNAWQGKAVQLELYTANGTRVQNLQIASASQTEILQMNTLSKGIYVVRASYGGELLEQKVVKY